MLGNNPDATGREERGDRIPDNHLEGTRAGLLSSGNSKLLDPGVALGGDLTHSAAVVGLFYDVVL